MGEFSALTQKTILNRFIKCVLVKQIEKELFILTFWKKLIFHVSDSTLYIKKTKILKSEKKWILMAYLSLP